MSDADELLKLKELLDSGILTQEEFDKKKNEILGKTKPNNVEDNIVKEETQIKSDSKAQEDSVENKKNNNVGWWIFFVLFLLATLGELTSGLTVGVICDGLICLLCLPPFMSWLKEKGLNLSTGIRILLIIVLMVCPSFFKYNKNDNSKTNKIEQSVVESQDSIVFVQSTHGKDFFQNVLCGNTQCEYKEPVQLKADNMMPFDTVTYTTGNTKYSFEVTTNTNDEIANVQMFYYDFGKSDPTNYFMAATRLDYPNKDVAQLTNFITENIGKDEKIKIGDFTFHFFKGTSDNIVILDIYTDEFASYNGN